MQNKKFKKFLVFESLVFILCFERFSLLGFEHLSFSVLSLLDFSYFNFLSNQTETYIQISLFLTSEPVFFSFFFFFFFFPLLGETSGGSMHGSITRASVHSSRWNKGYIWEKSQPS